MTNERLEEVIHQVLYNPQASYPPITYKITDVHGSNEKDYSSEYIDMEDFKSYLSRLEQQLNFRLKSD